MAIKSKAAICVLLTVGISGWTLALGQMADKAPRTLSRIVLPINETRLVTLGGNIRPEARPEFDLSLVDPQLPLERMLLILKCGPEQEATLESFMARQLDPHSSDFRTHSQKCAHWRAVTTPVSIA